AGRPRVVLLDEPMAGVATNDVPGLVELIGRLHRQQGCTVLMVEHHLDVRFDVAGRGVTALLGRNGVGKTTTLKAVLGLVRRRGEVLLDGVRIDGDRTHRIVARGVGYVPEDREIFARLTVAENLELAARTDHPDRQLVDRLFPELGERARQAAGTLSGGQQQMVALARVLQNENRLLLVDEPTKGLAPGSSARWPTPSPWPPSG